MGMQFVMAVTLSSCAASEGADAGPFATVKHGHQGDSEGE